MVPKSLLETVLWPFTLVLCHGIKQKSWFSKKTVIVWRLNEKVLVLCMKWEGSYTILPVNPRRLTSNGSKLDFFIRMKDKLMDRFLIQYSRAIWMFTLYLLMEQLLSLWTPSEDNQLHLLTCLLTFYRKSLRCYHHSQMAHQQLVSRTEELGYVTPQEDKNSK